MTGICLVYVLYWLDWVDMYIGVCYYMMNLEGDDTVDIGGYMIR